ncbi:L,D-transpeptidase [uncultured Cohaesibacter sp.]|uniref:L,D-transpeptidase n=1 Tax=uncultured Cohaesibacter sp. TaxID=1002546 RepID=UPI002AA70393|nr:L,D-transpeptidase [uncultured Cohaesibacter sp.]
MKHLILTACTVVLGFGGLAQSVSASSVRYAPPPPVMLSPDQIQPWVMQLRPGRTSARPVDARPRMNRIASVPSRPTYEASRKVAAKRTRGIDPRFLPTVVDYQGPEKPGTIIINTNERYLYLVNRDGTARRYGVGVGRPGFEWAGTHRVSRKAEWPGWTPPAEMRARQPGLPQHMEGGPRNPLGARALYLGSTLYRIHGSNEPWSIGHAVSSGCIRMRNEDVMDLYERVPVGTSVKVL